MESLYIVHLKCMKTCTLQRFNGHCLYLIAMLKYSGSHLIHTHWDMHGKCVNNVGRMNRVLDKINDIQCVPLKLRMKVLLSLYNAALLFYATSFITIAWIWNTLFKGERREVLIVFNIVINGSIKTMQSLWAFIIFLVLNVISCTDKI